MLQQKVERTFHTILYDNSFWLVLITASLLLFSRLQQPPIYILDEARNAQCAKEMMERNDWIVPTFNEELRQHKPPLHYYFMRLGYKMFGVNAFGARFFSAVMGLLTILITYFFSQRFLGRSAAILSSGVLICSTHFLFEFRLAVPDPYLIFFITLSLFSFYAFVMEDKLIWLITASVSVGLSILSKGPVALLLTGVPALCWLILQGKWKLIFSLKMLLAFTITLAVALPWFILVHTATGGAFTRGFFIEQNINRFNEPMEGHGGIFLLIPAFVIIGLLPAMVFLPGAMRYARQQFKHPVISFCIVAIFFTLLFFSLAKTKLPNYPMPCYAFAAVWLGYFINGLIEKKYRFKNVSLLVLFCINLLLFIAAVIGIQFEPALKGKELFAILFVILPLAAFISWRMSTKKTLQKALLIVLCGYTLFNLVFFQIIYPSIYKENPVTKALPVFKGKMLWSFEIYNPAFKFYQAESIPVFYDTGKLIKALQSSSVPILIVTRESSLPKLEGINYEIVFKQRDLFESPTTVLLELKK